MPNERSITLDEASAARLGEGPLLAMLDHGLLDEPGGVLQHVLLSTDGTVVPLLERCFGERIRLAGHVQSLRRATATDPPELDVTDTDELLHRKVLLQGGASGYNYVYADSLLVPARLPPTVAEELLTTSRPIGRVLTDHRVETFRELLQVGTLRAPVSGRADMPFRTYRIIVGGRPTMLISEHFPPFSPVPERPATAASVDGSADAPARVGTASRA